MSDKKIELREDKKLLRHSDVTLQIPDVTKFKDATGWEPKILFEQTLEDTMNYWRQKIN
jgi:nucleoside-diphosphate-sugar epimerase